MSKSHNQNVKIWKDFECKLGAALVHSNPDLSAQDIDVLSRAITLNTCSVYESLGRVVEVPLRLISFFKRFDIITVARMNKELFLILTRHRLTDDDSMRRFKHVFEVACGSYPVSSYFGILTKNISIFFSEGSALMLHPLVQFLTGWSRIQLRSLDHSEENISSYLAIEDHLRNLQIPPFLLGALNSIVKEWFAEEPFVITRNERHGNGSVADCEKTLDEKYSHTSTDPLLYYCTGEVPPTQRFSFDRISKTIFVPKTMLGDRVISMEPVTLQYWQQSVARSLDVWFSRSPLKHAIHLHDQTFNMEGARRASITGSRIATIDLSSASDCVSWDLVKNVFRGTPLLRWLFATRSLMTTIEGHGTIVLHKYAPMGSALCFPMECLIFSAIIELAYRVSRTKRHKEISPCGFLVYGDDLIVPTYLWNTLNELLTQFGFKVNVTKSYQHDSLSFRESCGGEYYGGFDVTPIRLPRNFCLRDKKRGLEHQHTWFTQSIDLCNRYFSRHLKVCRAIVLRDLLDLPPAIRPLFGEDGVWSEDTSNYHLNKVWSDDYQRYQLKHGNPVSKCDSSQVCEANRLHHWFHLTIDRSVVGDQPATSRTGPNTTRLGSVAR